MLRSNSKSKWLLFGGSLAYAGTSHKNFPNRAFPQPWQWFAHSGCFLLLHCLLFRCFMKPNDVKSRKNKRNCVPSPTSSQIFFDSEINEYWASIVCKIVGSLFYWPGTARRGLGWLRPDQSPPRCTKCNSPPISGQRANFILFDVTL